ncbi:hypothetical protein, partial [Serratia marcescens]|uniref:hypothetical protein n=1 Tax=Serratia marcescens TaxID=615 RepID=UPI0019535C67
VPRGDLASHPPFQAGLLRSRCLGSIGRATKVRSRIECPVGNETMTVLDRPFRKGISLKATLMALFGFMALI